MAKKEKIITVLDIGASKICCLIAEPEENGTINVLGYGLCHHNCLKEGVVLDIKGLSDAIGKAVYEAEDISGKKAHSVFFNISGSHIKGLSSHGEVIISDKDNEITRHDVERVISNAKAIHMPYERDIIYTVDRGFAVDGEKGIISPAGMFGIKVETELYLITAKISIIDNLKKAVRQAGIGIEDCIISGIATAFSTLSNSEKELGVVLIDIGADLTEILIFLEGRLSHLSVLVTGGNKITKAISDKFRIPEDAAEKIKIENGSLEERADKDDKIYITVSSRRRSIPCDELRKVLVSEYGSIFNAINKELASPGRVQDASSGVVICGQPAMMEGCLELAEPILNFPVRMAHIMGLGSSPKPLPGHIYATSMGLLKYGSISKGFKRFILNIGPKNLILAIIDEAKRLYNDYF